MKVPSIDETVTERLFELSVNRLAWLSYFWAPLFTIFGFASFQMIQNFRPEVTWWSNVWPRILLNSFPLMGLTMFLKSQYFTPKIRIYIWVFGFSLVFCTAACIHVWPIVLSGKPEILLYVNAVNNGLLDTTIILLGLPLRVLIVCTAIIAGCTWLPLFVVTYLGQNELILKQVAGDTVLLGIGAIFVAKHFSALLDQLVRTELNKELSAAKFLGPAVYEAIYHNKSDLLDIKTQVGFIACLDIRDSTQLLKKYRADWLLFRQEYFRIVSEEVAAFGGYLQKTMGDAHIINFGIMDSVANLDDIDALTADVARSEDNRLQQASNRLFTCLESIFNKFSQLSARHFPHESVLIGGGVDKGVVHRELQGDVNHHLELDFNGDPVNCAARLQEFSKVLLAHQSDPTSILVISPFASDYLSAAQYYEKIELKGQQIRNYEQIRWVLARRFIKEKYAQPNQKAG